APDVLAGECNIAPASEEAEVEAMRSRDDSRSYPAVDDRLPLLRDCVRLGDLDQCALELELAGQTRPALECVVELRQTHGDVAELVDREVARLRVELADVVGT